MRIQYDGIGYNGSKSIFTEYEFLKIMNENVTHKDWKNVPEFVKRVQLNFKDWILPDDSQQKTGSNILVQK